MMVEAKKIPELLPPAVYFPYPKMGQSASGIACDTTGGKFGPFAGQMFVGDQSASTVMRVVPGEGQRPLSGRLHPVPPGVRLGHPAAVARAGRLAVRRRDEPRLGLARQQAVRAGAADLDRQGPVRGPRDPRPARRLRADLHAARRPRRRPATRSRTRRKRTPTSTSRATAAPRSTRPTPTVEAATVAADGKSVRLRREQARRGAHPRAALRRRSLGRGNALAPPGSVLHDELPSGRG